MAHSSFGKQFVRNVVALTLLAMQANVAIAADSPSAKAGYYAFIDAGINILDDTTITLEEAGSQFSDKAGFDASFSGGAGLGYRFNNNFAVEGAFCYRRAELDAATLNGVNFGDGDFANTQLNLSALYFFDLFGSSRAETYVGAGIAWIQEVDIDLDDGAVEREFEADDFGFELTGGVRYYFAERGFVDGNIKYTGVGEVSLNEPGDSAARISADYNPWLVSLRLGYRF